MRSYKNVANEIYVGANNYLPLRMPKQRGTKCAPMAGAQKCAPTDTD